jgi:2'-5' RNA ligase
MRLFVALDLDADISKRIEAFCEQVRPLAPEARWVSTESLHVTLKFIGESPDTMRPKIESVLSQVHAPSFALSFRSTGFFPTPRSARVFWVGIEAESGLGELAKQIEDALAQLGIAKENRAFSPHLTLARARGASGAPRRQRSDKPNRQFAGLQEFLARNPVPEFGTMSAREFFLYRSQLSSKGPQYMKIAGFELKAIAH